MTKIMTNQKYPVAKMHKFLHAAPQFRPIKRGARRKGVEHTYTSKDGSQSLKMMLFYELDIADQDLLLCLISMSMTPEKSTVVGSKPNQELNIMLREKLKLDGSQVAGMSVISAKSTAYEILTETGRSVGKSGYEWLERALDRLAGVSFKFKSKTTTEGFHLLSWSATHENGRLDGIGFCINPYSASAILGDKGGYVLLHRAERAQLNTDSKALHSVLCGLVDMGAERVLNVDMLADKVYNLYDEIVTNKAIRSRRANIIKASFEINALSYWTCSLVGKGVGASLKITRKRRTEVLA